MRVLSILVLLLSFGACGRYFPGPLQPIEQQGEGMTVNDDGSITYQLDRLAINLKPMTDAELNRLAATGGDHSVNPYTFGEWSDSGEEWTPGRFTVFRLKIGNYQYPKIKFDPLNAHIAAANNRKYGPMSYAQLYDYYRAYWQGRTGLGRVDFQTRTDVLRRTMYSGAMVFSGRDEQGYLVFPILDDDVRRIDVHLDEVALRFNFADEPVETVDLSFSFQRDVLQGYTPDSAVRRD
ncbi:MAG: hypothetical protein GKR89_14215 [Candidatus Latescibacteria bacterium]|nr:hypothetical protein [Candidatus Latescibacterota bacterium]